MVPPLPADNIRSLQHRWCMALRPAVVLLVRLPTTPTQGLQAMQKSLHIDAEKCTGCLQCEMACSY